MMRAVVVGAGVVGLTTAIRLAERGHLVRIVARERTPHTTSDVAAAVYFPFRASPAHRVLPWARATYHVLAEQARDPRTGIVFMDIVEPVVHAGDAPWWRGIGGSHRAARAEELPPGAACGWVMRGPVIEMPRYMRWLESRCEALGVAFEERALASLDEALRGADVVVNCTGLGARLLVGDALVHPVRGQVVRVRNPGLARATLDESTPRALSYTIPRSDGVVCGGTADKDADDLAYDMATETEILRKAIEAEPALAGCEVVARNVGLRPARREVRLEAEPGRRIVHNYGHGGSGVTLSWGCAEEAAQLAERVVAEALLVAGGDPR